MVIFPPIECACGSIDGGCGCRRAMAGMVSHRATTTIKVTDMKDLDRRTYFRLIREDLKDQGYLTEELMALADVKEWLNDLTDDLLRAAELWPVGTILERRGAFISLRQPVTGTSV